MLNHLSLSFLPSNKLPSSIAIDMETLLRQSRSMCPFLQKTSPATLRSLSSSTRHVSPGGGTMSNLQVLGRRCPIMGKAMAVQTVKHGNATLAGTSGGARAYGGKAKLHTTRNQQANVDPDVVRRRDEGWFRLLRTGICFANMRCSSQVHVRTS